MEPLPSPSSPDILGGQLAVGRVVVPGAAHDTAEPDEGLRDALELDSLDFLAFVERLSERSGRRVEEEDYDQCGLLAGCVRFLSSV